MAVAEIFLLFNFLTTCKGMTLFLIPKWVDEIFTSFTCISQMAKSFFANYQFMDAEKSMEPR